VTVPAKPHSAVLCSIGKLSAVIGTGHANLLAQADKATVASVDGDVRTLLNDHWQTLAPGTVARFGGGQTGTPEPLLSAPRLLPGQRLWFALGDPVAISGFGFDEVATAERYELRLRGKDGSGEQLRSVVAANRLSEAFAPINPG
jgi:hypothetical protein